MSYWAEHFNSYIHIQYPFQLRDDSDNGLPESIDHLIMPEVPPSPDYIPGPEVPPSPDYIPGPEEPQSPPPLDFVPEPMYPEYMPQEDEILPAEEQHYLLAAISPTSDIHQGMFLNDEDEDEDGDEEEEEEHPAPADSVPPVHRMTARISIRDEPSDITSY
ncbi:hypothetical protein Tco_0993610 [Tanacetum coccineum]